MTRKIKKTLQAYLRERPSVRVGMNWDAEGLMLVISNSDGIYVLKVLRSQILTVLKLLTVIEEECSEKSGGGWHLRINGSTAAARWAYANGLDGTDRMQYICDYDRWNQYIDQYKQIFGERTKNAGRTAEWVLGQFFEGSTLRPHNDRKNNNESDIELADGTVWEIKCIALNSRAQIKVQDGTEV